MLNEYNIILLFSINLFILFCCSVDCVNKMHVCVFVDISRDHNGTGSVFTFWFDYRCKEKVFRQSLLGRLCQTQLHCESPQ